jgi:cellulose synthase/poly-beta-1,6-N-acetylglucosamine synthase-like glycosyltransferase
MSPASKLAPQALAASRQESYAGSRKVALNPVVVIPTYNERRNISTLIHTIHQLVPDMSILVVDDSSPDGTAEEVLELKRVLGDKVSLYSRPQKKTV